MSWLSHATGIHISPHGASFNGGEFKSGVSNLAKNVSPLLAFTPAGVLGAGLLAGVGELGRGKNIGQAVRAGLSNATIGAGARAAVGATRGLLSSVGSSSGDAAGAAGNVAGDAANLPGPGTTPAALPMSLGPSIATTSPGGLASVANITNPGRILERASAAALPLAPPVHSSAFLTMKDAAHWIGENHGAIGGTLSGLGQMRADQASIENQHAQTAATRWQVDREREDYERERKRREEMAPLWGSLGTAFGNGFGNLSPNPYVPKANPYGP